MTDSRTLVIHHSPCVDGFAAAWVAHRHFASRGGCELVAARYGDPPPDVNDRDVVIVDFSYPRDVLLKMRERARTLLVLDHHRTAEEDLRGLPFARFDMSRSGAGLAWDRFFPWEERPWIVDYVEDRDLWRWALPNSRAVSAYLRTIDFDLEAWTRIAEQPVEEVAARGRAILAYVDALVRSHVERAALAELAGHTVPVVNATAVVSEIGNELARGEAFAVIWSVGPDGRYLYSLRSCRETPGAEDVSEIARRFGGGGHRHAAGFAADGPVHRIVREEG